MSELNQITSRALEDAPKMLDLTRMGEKSAELMLEEVFADISKGRTPEQTEKMVNQYIKTINSAADTKAGSGYNLNFEIVDANADGKWNQGEKVKVHNESRYSFRQPAAFELDGSPDTKQGLDPILRNRVLEQGKF